MAGGRVERLRERLAPLLGVLSESARADLEEVFELAERGAAAESGAWVERTAAESAAAVVAEGGAVEPATPIEAPASLRHVIIDVLAGSAEPMRVRDITDAARARGWSTQSANPGHVVAAVLSSRPEFVAVRRGFYALRPALGDEAAEAPARVATEAPIAADTSVAAEAAVATAPPAEPQSIEAALRIATASIRSVPASELHPPPPVASTAAPRPTSGTAATTSSEAASDAHRELEFLLRHVEEARADTAVLAPSLLRLQITSWIARARALRDRARGDVRVERETGRVAAELGTLCKLWWPGSVEALKIDTRPLDVARSFRALDGAGPSLSWSDVGDALDAALAEAWAEPGFDDGWADSRALCEDERFVGPRLDLAEGVLARIGTPIGERPTGRASFEIAASDLTALIEAARGVRWVRGVATDGARWGAIIGRLRWLAATHPQLGRGPLGPILKEDQWPGTSGWGFDHVLRAEEQAALRADLDDPDLDLLAWLTRAIDVFDTLELARALGDRREQVEGIEPSALMSRRVRGRLRKLRANMGLADAGGAAPPVTEAPRDDEPSVETTAATSDPFGSVRRVLHERLTGTRALFISNREDGVLQSKVATAFGLELEWCVASPRRMGAASDAIRGGRYDVILSATGFQDHTMDAAFSRAAKDSGTLYVRVNRGRPAACARAIARELGVTS